MPLGTGADESGLVAAEVHTTTECARRRITERSCSGRGRASKAASWCGCGWTEGAFGGVTSHASLRAQDWENGRLWKSGM
jgi:hypothetical protein